MQNWLVLLILITAAALSGCAGADPEAPDAAADTAATEATTDAGDADTPTAGETGANGAATNTTTNTLPVIEGDTQVDGVAGQAVEFAFNATDADGDELTWAFDAYGNGTQSASGEAFPAVFNFTYSMGGTFEAVFTVSDGIDESAHAIFVNVTELLLPVETPLRYFFHGAGAAPVPAPAPSGLGIEGTMDTTPGTSAKAVATTGPGQSVIGADFVTWASAALDAPVTISGTTLVQDRGGADWEVATGATAHICLAGNANGVFDAFVYERINGEDTLVLENDGKEFAGTSATPGCTDHKLGFANGMTEYTFQSGSQIVIMVVPDQFAGSVATEILYDGAAAPEDSSLDLIAWM